MEPGIETAQIANTSPDFSALAMFLQATPVVQAVMLGLLAASIWSWTVILRKSLAYREMRQRIDVFEEAFLSGAEVSDLFERVNRESPSVIERVFMAGVAEWRKSLSGGKSFIRNTPERVDRAMHVALDREATRLKSGLSGLATLGSTAPFIGLFATVWGIKHSFESIAAEQSSNLAVVAPGIAEALLATALGLFVAIPAVVAYNRLSRVANGLNARVQTFAEEFSILLQREMSKDAPNLFDIRYEAA